MDAATDNRPSGRTGDRATPRARFGLIIPSSNRMAEAHAWAYAPPGVVPHVTRLRMTGTFAMKHDQLLPKAQDAAAMLADAKCNPVVFHCTANSMAEGLAGEEKIAAALSQATGAAAVTTASATMAALDALQARRIVLVSPYKRKAHEHEIEFLQEAGIEVVGERNLDLNGSDEYCAIEPLAWLDIVAAVESTQADAYFVSCANIRATEAIPQLEARLGKPVVTSNQAVIWRAVRLAGIVDDIPALGRLAWASG
ncbi:MAG: hypothetical protein AB7F96_17915 [Beijerinckiaceae bacterium]